MVNVTLAGLAADSTQQPTVLAYVMQTACAAGEQTHRKVVIFTPHRANSSNLVADESNLP